MRRTIGVLITYALILSTSSLAIGETLDEWKALENVSNCAGVPYSTLRETCHRSQVDVKNYCKSSTNAYSCEKFHTKPLLEIVEKIKGAIEQLIASRKEQSERSSNAKSDDERREAERKLSEIDDKLSKAQGRLQEHNRLIEENKAEAERRVANGEKCRDARRIMFGIFVDVITRAKAESDPAIKAIAERKISREWEPENKEHDDVVKDDVLPAIERCNACRRGEL